MRHRFAVLLCVLASAIAVILGVVAGLGLTVALIVLVATDTIKIGTGLIVFLFGLPLLEGLIGLVNGAVGVGLLAVARALDPDVVEQWLENQEADEFLY